MTSLNPEVTIKTEVDYSHKTRRGIVTLCVSDSGRESLHRLPLPNSVDSELRAQLQAILDALLWGSKLQRSFITVLTPHVDSLKIINRDMPVNEHTAGMFLQIRALLHSFKIAQVKLDPNTAVDNQLPAAG
ncbi:MAG TPA: hypothetical protein DCY84_02970 [Firmicutes bacterium]|nr:hypothetical protein [Bacillota bacterium]HAZ21316.1 hypothetical protein [Bacillota bacterium]HCM16873.1 hypothetical protein [Bacillota bacterium]HCT35810.1 hypothetical protein [Bacillota bacterium]